MPQLEQLYIRLNRHNIMHSITFIEGKTLVTSSVLGRKITSIGIKTMTLTFDNDGLCIDTTYGTKAI